MTSPESTPSRRQVLAALSTALIASTFGQSRTLATPATTEPLRGQNFKAVSLTPYALSGMEIEKAVSQFRSTAQEKPPLCDILFRIEEDLSRTKVIAAPVSSEHRGLARKQLVKLTQQVGEAIVAIERREKRRATTDECIDAFNSVLFKENNFQFPSKEDFQRTQQSSQTYGISEVLRTRRGVCEDLTGIYLSIADILNRQGFSLEVQARVAPGHVFVSWKDQGKTTNVELTRQGRIVSEKEYQDKLHFKTENTAHVMRIHPHGFESELYNGALAMGDVDPALSRRYVDILLFLDRADSNALLLKAGLILQSSDDASYERRMQLRDQAKDCLQAAFKLDPDLTPAAQILLDLHLEEAKRSLDPAEKVEKLSQAIRLIKQFIQDGTASRPNRGILFSITVNWNRHLGEAYLAKYQITGKDSDLDSAKEAIRNLHKEKLTIGWSIELIRAEFDQKQDRRLLRDALTALNLELMDVKIKKGELTRLNPTQYSAICHRPHIFLGLREFKNAEADFRIVARDLGEPGELPFYGDVLNLTGLAAALVGQGKREEATVILKQLKVALGIDERGYDAYCRRLKEEYSQFKSDTWSKVEPGLKYLEEQPELVRLLES